MKKLKTKYPIVSIIVAVAENNAIGKNNDLIWHLPNDMKFFKTTTENHPVIMGRKNYHSIPEKYRPLPNRQNIIVTRQHHFFAPNCIVKNTLEEAIEFAKGIDNQEIFIIGGGQIYKEAIDKKLVDKLYYTKVHHHFEADTFFPEINFSEWELISTKKNHKDDKHLYDFTFFIYEKI
jgi:dihydrofolate reductase